MSESSHAARLFVTEQDLYLFNRGEQERAYQFMGAHHRTIDGIDGVHFVVWAPAASAVSVTGDFNGWNQSSHPLHCLGDSGVWETFVPGIAAGMHYKYCIVDSNGNTLPLKADPYAQETQLRPDSASMVPYATKYRWQDGKWMKARKNSAAHESPLLIYEVHLGSWRRDGNNHFLNYKELARQLVAYVKELGFTHIQLMPISEYPFDGSWGYQPIGLFSPTRRFGSPDEFRFFVNHAHRNGIGVLLDWVPAHFPSDEHGLGNFDGTSLYEHADPRKGYHPDWNTLIFNYGRAEVVSYLLSNAMYWLEEFHLDGLRFDAVASMLYLNYSRKEGEWLPNQHGGFENLEAIHLLRNVNERVHLHFPGVLMIAEESTAWPGVTDFTSRGGLGFGFKWNLGWMNDTLSYMSRDPVHRKYHHQEMTFGLLYAFSESFILALSHDEVVHGKRSLLEKMPGDDWQKFANLRAYLGFMWAHPGKKLLFMGDEIAQRREWNHDSSLDWHLLDHAPHNGIRRLVGDLNQLCRGLPALHELDDDDEGFEWIDADGSSLCVFIFLRRSRRTGQVLVAASNMTAGVHHHFRIGVPVAGVYKEAINTDSHFYGGSGVGNFGEVTSQAHGCHGRADSIVVTLPPLASIYFVHESA